MGQAKQNHQLPQEQERQEQDPLENHLCNGATQQQDASEGALLESISNAGMEMLQKQLQDLQLVLHTKDNEIQHLQESAANTAAATQPPAAGEENEVVSQVSHLETEVESL